MLCSIPCGENNMQKTNVGPWLIVGAAVVNVLLWSAVWLTYAPDRENFHRQVLGETVGSTAMVLFACALCLAARPRFLEPYFGGLDRMYVAHKNTATFAFLLLCTHFFFVPIHIFPPKPGGFLGIVAFFGFLVTVLLALGERVPIIGRYTQFSYHRWRNTHRFVGLFFIIVFGHAIFVDSVMHHVGYVYGYFGAFYLLGVGAYLYKEFLAGRIGKHFAYRVTDVLRLNGTTSQITLAPANGKMSFQAGQFLFVHFDGDKILREPHPFTISSAPSANDLRLTIKASGDFTRHLQTHLKVGARATLEGAYGRMNYKNGARSQIWIAGGIGITPFLSWVRDFGDGLNYDIDFFYAVRSRDEALFWDEWEAAVQKFPNFRAHLNVSNSDGSLTLEKILAAAQGELKEKEIYMCGPIRMVYAFEEQFRKAGVPEQHIHYEEFNFR
jgi:predicted ferric reductase